MTASAVRDRSRGAATAIGAGGAALAVALLASAPLVYEAVDTTNIDLGHAVQANTVFAQAAGGNVAYRPRDQIRTRPITATVAPSVGRSTTTSPSAGETSVRAVMFT